MNLTFSSYFKFQIQKCYAYKNLFNTSPFIHYVGIRKLISPSILGLDKFLLKRTQIQDQFKNSRARYIEVMEGLYMLKENSFVNSEDLKNMIYICEREEYELKILQRMFRSFMSGDQKFESLIIGMEYLRLLHIFKLPNEMRKVLNEKESFSLFGKLISYVIAMSLFYDYKLYKDVIDVYHKMMSETVLQRPPKLQTILAMASCYHLNSSWSFQEAISILGKLEERFRLDSRSLSFAAALALRRNHAYEALEITSKTAWNCYLLRNLKILALVSVGREEDALPVLRGYSGGYSKHPSKNGKDDIVLLSTISSVEKALSQNQKSEALLEFNIIKKDLEKKSLIENITLKAALHEPVDEDTFHRDTRAKNTMIAGSFERGMKRAKAQKKFSRVGFKGVK